MELRLVDGGAVLLRDLRRRHVIAEVDPPVPADLLDAGAVRHVRAQQLLDQTRRV